MMKGMDTREPALLEASAPPRAAQVRPSGLLPRSPRGAVEIVRHVNGPLEVKVSGLVDSAERRIRQWQGGAGTPFLVMVGGAALPVGGGAPRWGYARGPAGRGLHGRLVNCPGRQDRLG